MNRIILVGNGYDLSCNLKTSYQDFLINYIKSSIQASIDKESVFEDDLIKVENRFLGNVDELFTNIETIDDLIANEHCIYGESSFPLPLGKNSSHINLSIKSNFLRELLQFENWTNIEGFYFKKLLQYYNEGNYNIKDAEYLNIEFELIKQEFIKYLQKIERLIEEGGSRSGRKDYLIEQCITPLIDKEYDRFFSNDPEPKIKTQFDHLNKNFSKKLDKVWFVNFNYTSMLWKHIETTSKQGIRYIPIHGQINRPKDIIFGYGDDTHKEYYNLEQTGKDDFLKNIKSFYYSKEKHYIDIVDFIEMTEYDVFVIGHSLGLSDRVLLKTIFENDNCRAIRLFHRGTEEDQFNKRLALSRHFDDKLKMRRKIVEWDERDRIW